MSEHQTMAGTAAALTNVPGLIFTPGGLRSADRVVTIRDGETVRLAPRPRRLAKTVAEQLLTYAEAVRANWIEAVYCKGGIIQLLTMDIVVPGEPVQRGGQLLYVFAGLQDEPTTMVLQPVIQWGAPGDPPGWRLCSWIVDRASGIARPTRSVAVAPGSRVRARIAMTGRNGSRFSYACGFDEAPATNLSVASVPALRTAVAVLEAYRIRGADDYPPDPAIRFEDARMLPTQTAHWQTQNLVIDCGQHAEIVDAANPTVFELHCRP